MQPTVLRLQRVALVPDARHTCKGLVRTSALAALGPVLVAEGTVEERHGLPVLVVEKPLPAGPVLLPLRPVAEAGAAVRSRGPAASGG